MNARPKMNSAGWKSTQVVLMVLFILGALWSFPYAVQASDPEDTLDKIGRIIDQARDIVETIREGEVGEKELLEELSARFQSNEDLEGLCGELCREAGDETTIAEYHLLFSGLLGEVQPIDLVKTVKEKLAKDGFTILHEEKSGGRKAIWFDNRPLGQPREKRYVLWINEAWTRKLTDFFTRRQTNQSFCLAKIKKI